MNMSKIVETIGELREIAARDPVNYGPTGPAIAVAARQASEEIVRLTEQYGEFVKKGAVAIFLTGPVDRKKFGTIWE